MKDALPLNPNGPLGTLATLEKSPRTAAITLLPVQNLKFEVLTPNQQTGTRLHTLCLYFELHTGGANLPIPVIGTDMKPADIMTWHIPYANATYKQGYINFAHNVDKGVRVKIMWPFFQNRTLIAHFDSTMRVGGLS